MEEAWVQPLVQEDPLEEEMVTHPVFLPGESHGQRSLVGYSSQGHKEFDTTERLHSLTPALQADFTSEPPGNPVTEFVFVTQSLSHV